MTILQDLVLKIIKELLKSQGKQFKGGYLESETDITASTKNVKFQPEPEPVIKGGDSWANLKPTKEQKGAGVKKSNPWLEHVKQVRSQNQGLAYKDVLKKAKETYTKTGGQVKQVKTEHFYKSRVVDPVAEQKDQQNELKQKKPRGRPRKSAVTVDIPKATYTKSKTVKEQGKKLTVKKPLKHEILDEPTKLSFEKPKERKFEKTTLDRILGVDTDLLTKRKTEARKVPQESEDILGLMGNGLETELLKKVVEEVKDIKPITKKKTMIRKIVKDEMKKRGLKPVIAKQILNYVLTQVEKLSGGVSFGTSYAIVNSLEKGGIFDASKSTLKSLTDRLDEIMKDPNQHRKQVILTRDIPNLKFKYDKLQNTWDIKGKSFSEKQRDNHQLRMLNTKSHIVALLNRVAGINMVSVKK
jgi:hypothetical protein